MATSALASSVDVSVVDTTAPTGSVSLTAGSSAPITINMQVTGNQPSSATFDVDRNWTLSGGTFTGSNPQTFNVPARAATDPATTFSTSGVVTVASGQAPNSTAFTLHVGAVNITNAGSTGRLGAGTVASYNVTVTAPADTTKPVLTLPSNITTEATGPAGAVVTFTATATDNVDGSVPVTCMPPSGSTFALGTTTVNCGAHDAAGNSATGSFTVTVQDTTKPVVSVPADKTVEATSASGATVTYSGQSASDIVDGTSDTVTCTPASGSTFPLGATTVTCTATDAAGNTGSNTFKVTVQDTTKPVVSVPDNISAEATSGSGAVVNYDPATASDIVDGSSDTVTCLPASGSTFPLGVNTVTCSATDNAGNTGTNSFTISVNDTTGPVVTVPSNITAEATGPDGAVVTWSGVSALDAVDGDVPATCDPASGSTFGLGETTVTCSATDAHSNEGQNGFTVTVQDTTPPTVTVPDDVTVEATGPDGASATFDDPTASDLVDGAVTPDCNFASGDTFPLGATTVTCTATDKAGNTSDPKTFTVTVQDTTPPSVTVPDDMTAEATGPGGAIVTFAASATDIVDGTDTVTCDPASGAQFALGDTTVSCTSTDAAGNTSDPQTFTVTVHDTTPPTVHVPADKTVEATGPSGAAVSFSASATDLVDGTDTVTCTPASGSTFALGTHSVSCSATDNAGNTGSGAFNVTVQDTTPPTVTVPSDITAEATGPGGAHVTFTTSATDIVDGTDSVTCDASSGDLFGLGATTVHCSSTDAAGNVGHASFKVTVVDTTAPVVTVPADKTVAPTSVAGAVVNFTASASDIVDGSVPVTCTPPSGSTFAIGTTTVNCSATDAHGNTGYASFKVTVAYTFSGFFAPVNNLPTVNTSKAGQAIPVKFSLNGNQGLNIFVQGYPSSVSYSCNGTAPTDAIEQTVTAGSSSLQYDPTTDQYTYVWKTDKAWAGTCRALVVKLIDGSVKTANFSFTK